MERVRSLEFTTSVAEHCQCEFKINEPGTRGSPFRGYERAGPVMSNRILIGLVTSSSALRHPSCSNRDVSNIFTLKRVL